ncbi:MAG TPA: adenylate/guanylate cyclase domain-containing protein [Planctomycetaceae bacterium]|nr:adenylate/guanylate cyclase domain-containing protein [Planctomycetaceae bacterium]
MIRLIAQGPLTAQSWNEPLRSGETYVLGRGAEADLTADWDSRISRRHAELRVLDGAVEIRRLATAANPLCFEGREVDACRLEKGGVFVIGQTAFHVIVAAEDSPSPARDPVEEITFEKQELRKVRFRDADQRIEVLWHLPEVIWAASGQAERDVRLVNLILAGVAHADAAAIVTLGPGDGARLDHWERRRETAGAFRPSGRLVGEALRKRKRTVLHVWEGFDRTPTDYTASAEFDWAFCTPVGDTDAGPCGLYVAGRMERPFLPGSVDPANRLRLEADVKFTELVAEIIRSVERLKKLERRQSSLRQFFAPQILAALGDDFDTDLLEPRECDVTVLFCDLRGFSQRAEESGGDLLGLLDRVSRALGVMTDEIRRYRGVTGDFLGDAALGFWGWPFASDEAPLDACRAALAIRRAFAEAGRQAGHPLADFEIGIGVARGRAVAGKIGTRDQVKVTVFGPVVNLASRLEGMTRQLHVSILLDEATAAAVRSRLDPAEGRVRALARVLPYGMETPVVVTELLPPESEVPALTDAHLRSYEQAVEHFIAGRWEDAHRALYGLPEEDRAQDFLRQWITRHHRVAPPDWDGTVALPSK